MEYYCGACGSECVFLGALGKLAHFRCRSCGAMFSPEMEPEEKEELAAAKAEEDKLLEGAFE